MFTHYRCSACDTIASASHYIGRCLFFFILLCALLITPYHIGAHEHVPLAPSPAEHDESITETSPLPEKDVVPPTTLDTPSPDPVPHDTTASIITPPNSAVAIPSETQTHPPPDLPEHINTQQQLPVSPQPSLSQDVPELPTNDTTRSTQQEPGPVESPLSIAPEVQVPQQKDDILPQRDAATLPPVPVPDKHYDALPSSSPLAGTVMITEVLLGTSTSTREEYVEIFNNGTTPISLKGFALKKMTKSGTESNLAAAKSLDAYTIAPQSFFVIAHTDFTDTLHADAPFSGKSFTIAENSTITLYDNEKKIIDRVGFGAATVFEKNPMKNPIKNESIERRKIDGAYVDTDDNASDFIQNSCPQPGKFTPDNANAQITISEIYPKPCAEDDVTCMYSQEFIELHNPHPFPVSLEKWRIRDASKNGMHIFTADDVLPAHAYHAFSKDIYTFALNDTGGEYVSLINPLCAITDTVAYEKARTRLSYNASDASWYWADPTPHMENMPNPAAITYPELQITEVLPYPEADDRTNEYIEIYNPTDSAIDLKNWQLRDASAKGLYTFSTETILPPHTFLAIYRTTFSFALNNTGDTVSLLAPSGAVTSTISYASARKGVSYNLDDAAGTWRWSRHLTPNAPNIFNNLPIVVKKSLPTTGYKNVFTEFSLTAKDMDGEKLKIRWDFGDGRRSYLWKTRHKYLKNGTYNGSVRIQDGSEDITVPFTITITTFPRYKIAITELSPNPEGRDTGVEYIALTNRSKKNIDLFGWSVATGTTKKRIVNHFIREHIILKKGATIHITRTHAAITLPNTTGVIELRMPDSTTIDSVSYAAPGKNVPEDALYVRHNNVWQWHIVPNAQKRARAYAIAAAAAERENARMTHTINRDAVYTFIHSPALQKRFIATASLWLQHITYIVGTLNASLTKIVTVLIEPPHSTAVSDFPLYAYIPTSSACVPHTYITPPHTTYTLCTHH